MKKIMIVVSVGFILFNFGCGVKGDPKPPLSPTEIGHGQPSFYRASKNFKIENTENSIESKSGNPVQNKDTNEKE